MWQTRDMGSDATDEIAAVAYRLWLERGCPHGSDQEDWFRAEALLETALVVKGEAPSEVLDDFAAEIWQEGHWEVWEREWVGARWVLDPRHLDKAA